MSSLLELLKAWGPLGALIVAFVDGVGLPNPGGPDYLLLFLGYAQPQTAILSGFLAVVGALAGSLVLFWMARKGGQKYLDQKASGPRAMRFRRWFARYGMVTVFIPALVPVIPFPMKVFVLCSGALGVSPVTFLAVMALGKLPRYVGLAYLGKQLGEHGAKEWLGAHRWHFLLGAVALMAGLFLLVKVMDHIRGRREA
ncbi:MAG: VTT domain-containing protein [Acidobacteria bacterium]|nr:VTT domain-containing protein [Acidobacteriota bacterium]